MQGDPISELDSLPSIDGLGLDVKGPKGEPPTNFNSIFKGDFDITQAHRFVLDKLEEKKKSKKIEKKIGQLEESLKRKGQTLVDKKFTQSKIKKLEKKKERLSTIVEDYLREVSHLIEEYKKIGSIDKVLSFSNEKKESKETPGQRKHRERIITSYLELTRKYYQINAVLEGEEVVCPGCEKEFPKETADEFTSTACENCGLERKRLAKVPVTSENIKDNINRNNYEERKNFIKAMERFQGKQVIKNTSNLFRDLDDHFTSYGLPPGEEIQKLPLDKRGKKPRTNKRIMFEALGEKGYAHYYKNVNLICHLYWGWSLPDLTDIEERLLQDYDTFQRAYEKVKTTRKFGLNNDYMLLILLLKQGYKCSKEDFKIVKTEEIFEEYEETRRKIYQELGWRFQSLG